MTTQSQMADEFRPELGELAETAAARMFATIKATMLRDVLDQFGLVYVHLDGSSPDVLLPDAHRTNPRLALRLGYNMTPPMTDLEIGRDGFLVTLSFNGAPFQCAIAWSAVYGIRIESGQVLGFWIDSMRPDTRPDQTPEPEAPKPKLSLVP